MLELILVVAMPWVVKYSTNLIKGMKTLMPTNGWRVPVVRAVVAVLSLIGAILTQWIGEGQLNPSLIETTGYTVFNAVAATILYFIAKK